MSDLERDVRDADSRSGLWFLLGIVFFGSALQMLWMPSTGSAAPHALAQVESYDALVGAPAQDRKIMRPVERSVHAPRSEVRVPATNMPANVQSPRPVPVSPQRDAVEPAPRHGSDATRGNAEPAQAAAADRRSRQRDAKHEATGRPEGSGRRADASRSAVAPIVVLPSAAPAPAQQPPAQDEDEAEEPPVPSDSGLDANDGHPGRGVDSEPDNARIVVIGPAGVRARDFVTFTLAAENVKGLSHAPIRLAYAAAVLEFVSAEEGGFLASDGATTQFMVAPGETPGTLDIALSRMAAAGGIDGSGVLCTVTFLARAPGMSPIVTAGSRFLDPAARGMNLRSDDAYVSVQ